MFRHHNPRPRDSHSRRAGFTLIEVLVAISIIAQLIDILLPACGAARCTAINITCLSNFRQMAILTHSYTVKIKDTLPLVYQTRPGSSANWPDSTDTNEHGWTGIGLLRNHSDCGANNLPICRPDDDAVEPNVLRRQRLLQRGPADIVPRLVEPAR